MTGNTQINIKSEQTNECDNMKRNEQTPDRNNGHVTKGAEKDNFLATDSSGQDGKYWQMRYESLKNDYDHLQKINQNLEEKLLSVVESFEKKQEEMLANAEYEKTTLMADVDKLSTKLVDARMKLHDREEKDIMHAAECASPCHTKTITSQVIPIVQPNQRAKLSYKYDQEQTQQMHNDPNLV